MSLFSDKVPHPRSTIQVKQGSHTPDFHASSRRWCKQGGGLRVISSFCGVPGTVSLHSGSSPTLLGSPVSPPSREWRLLTEPKALTSLDSPDRRDGGGSALQTFWGCLEPHLPFVGHLCKPGTPRSTEPHPTASKQSPHLLELVRNLGLHHTTDPAWRLPEVRLGVLHCLRCSHLEWEEIFSFAPWTLPLNLVRAQVS